MKGFKSFLLYVGLVVGLLYAGSYTLLWCFYAATDTWALGEIRQTGTKDVYLVGFRHDSDGSTEALTVEDIRTWPPYYETHARDRFLSAVPGQRACIRVVGLRVGMFSWSRNLLKVHEPDYCKGKI